MRAMLRGTRAVLAFRRCGLGGVSRVARMGRGCLRVRGVRTGRGFGGGGRGAGHFASAADPALCVATVAAAGADQGGFGNVKAAAGVDLDAGGRKFVPAAELGEGDAESVGDGDQGVAAAGGVVDGVCRWGRGRSDGYDESLNSIELAGLVQLIRFSKRGNRDAVGVGYRSKGVFRCDLVIAP